MKPQSVVRKVALALLVALGAVVLPFQASSEDIDIFAVDENTTVNNPNVLIVLDNTSNWSRQSQQWPGGEQQGQSEVAAIAQVVSELDSTINVGMMQFVTEGTANDDGGYVSYHVRPMNATNKSAFTAILNRIYTNITAPIEKRNSNTAYGNLMYDVYNYWAGGDVSNTAGNGNGAGTPDDAGYADTAAYDPFHTKFRSPLTTTDTCSRTIIIFIGNADSSGPVGDSAYNVTALEDVGGSTTQIKFADYTIRTSPTTVNRGYSDTCFASAAACAASVSGTACTDQGYTSCSCNSADFIACPLKSFTITGTESNSVTTIVSDTTTTAANQYTGEATFCQNNNPGSYTCPAASTTTTTSGNQTTSVTTSWAGCAYAAYPNTCGNSSNKTTWKPQGTRTTHTVVRETNTVTSTSDVGQSACVESSAGCDPATFPPSCSGFNQGCACTGAGDGTTCGAGTNKRFQTTGTFNATTVTPTGTFSTPPTQAGNNFMADEWARFLRQTGVTIAGTSIKSQVTTYTIDVFNAQQNATQTALLFNMARVGGGKYFAARNKNSLIDALRQIFTEVQAVNSAFSSASLPVNATNRAQNENQVFIGVFRPDRTKDPLWFGNLKRYQIINNAGTIELGDSLGRTAINNQTGFISECAVSYWTTDSGSYWNSVVTDDPDAAGTCATSTSDVHSDLPDGPFVEKGAVAEVLRKSNNPGATADAAGNFVLSRTVLTQSGGALVPFTSAIYSDGDATTTNDATVADFIRGMDNGLPDEDIDGTTAEPRASIHGDVVHSRPQPVNYGGATGVVVYYGANDGTYRAVKASTGQELWSFVAPEHYSKFPRLYSNAPAIKYFGDSSLTAQPKDYFFDGSTGVLQNADNTTVMIYPTQRRGGRKVYGFNVANPASPALAWSQGCPSLTNDTGCTAGFSEIGQTWSLPSAAFVRGYSGGTSPLLMFGGGYDRCEDEDTAFPSCGSAKGRGVYFVDAQSGALQRYIDLSAVTGSARSVSSDLALVDIDQDGKVDYAYAVDMGGSIYRIGFIDNPVDRTPLAPASWTVERIAYTSGGGRKFLFPPALFQANDTTIYLAIGSGDREHPLLTQYPYEDVENRFYVFKDDLTGSGEFSLDDPTEMSDYSGDTDCDTPSILPSSAERGWFMSLTDHGPGEQVVTSAVIAGGFAIFSTNRPTPPSGDACTTSLGDAFGYFVNLLNSSGGISTDGTCGGEQSSEFVGGGLPPSPVIATVPVGEGDAQQVRTVVIGAVQQDGGASSVIGAQRIVPPISSIRRPVYWFKQLDAE